MIQTYTTITKKILLLVLVSLTSFIQAQAPVITCPGTTVTYGDQSNNDVDFWNAATWWDANVNSQNLAENAVPLSVNITDTCTTGVLKIKYILYLDLDNNGSLETRVDSDTLPAANTIHFNNVGLAVTAGEPRQFDFRPVPAADKYRFDLLLDAVSPTAQKAQLVWRNTPTATTLAQLPSGSHKIKWIVTNGCGQQSTCEYKFIIGDRKRPTIVCESFPFFSLPITIYNGALQLWASDFIQYAEDNITPAPQLVYGIRKKGTGTFFPYDTLGMTQTGVMYDCSEIGTNIVEIWVMDKEGNMDFCEASFQIEDNTYGCLPDSIFYGGQITTEINEGIEFVVIDGFGTSNGVPPYHNNILNLTDAEGKYNLIFDYSLNSNATITPTLESNPLNGVNTMDLILIKEHLLGTTPLNSPYKLISADANKSGSVTLFDVKEIRNLILGVYQHLPANSSWRFINKGQIFTNPFNPFADVLDENSSLDSIFHPFDFIGIKIGDVDLTAIPHSLSAPLEDRSASTAFSFQDQNIQENEVVSLHFAALSNIAGYQMTLDLSQFELLEIIPQNDLTMDHFAIFDQAITMVAEQPNQGFDLRLRAKQAGQLSSMLAVNDKITRSMAFEANGASKGIELRFNPIQKEAIQLNQNVPNPWQTTTNIGFYLPEANAAVTFTVVDEMGRVVYTATNIYPAGYQSIALDESMVPQAGMYWYSLTTAKEQLVQKMVKF
jgi:hypothetical protein